MPKVLVNTIPKSGTHLMANFVWLTLTGEHHNGRGRFIREVSEAPFSRCTIEGAVELRAMKGSGLWTGHIFYHHELPLAFRRCGLTTLFLYRDPRAVIVSRAHYMTDHHGHYHSEHLRKFKTISARVCAIIRGWGTGDGMDPENAYNIADFYDQFEGWRYDVPAFRYEDLLSDGASQVERIAEIFGVEVDNPAEVATSALGIQTATFRVGTVDAWRYDWTEQHEALFNRVAPDFLKAWGYADAD